LVVFALATFLFGTSAALAEDTAVVEKNSPSAESKASSTNTQGNSSSSDPHEAEPQSETTESVQEDVDKATEEKTDDRRQKLVKDAVSAVEMTRQALASLDEGKTDDALETLEKVTGKLALLVARDPELAAVPVAVTTTIYDVFAEVDSVKKIVNEAEDALDDGRVQDARRLLKGLASEVVISTSHMPMATYPDAIRAVAPLIDEGKIDEAKQQLQLALNLLVVSDVVYPLPTTRANAMLDEAEKLAEKSDRTKEENKRLDDLLKETRSQVEFGRELGYFVDGKADSIYDELKEIERKTGKGKSGKGFFSKVRSLFSSLSW
jgi:hypothetical protein